jgi:hypothetical protein
LVVIHCRYVNIGVKVKVKVKEKKIKEWNVDIHFIPFLSLTNVIGDENIKEKSRDVIEFPRHNNL